MAAVSIHAGYYLIDTNAWISHRIGERNDAHTDALAEFLRCSVFHDYHPNMDNAARTQLWCAAREWTVLEGSPIWHDHPQLTKPAEIVLAADPDGNAWALISIDYQHPAVYPDLTTDDGYWQQVTPVDITCPAGHRWSWLDERHLLDDTGAKTTIADLFGPAASMPFEPCRDCAAFDDGESDQMCLCDGPTAIYCPVCDRPCSLQLPDLPTVDRTLGDADGRQ